jgi:hypothetical protein
VKKEVNIMKSEIEKLEMLNKMQKDALKDLRPKRYRKIGMGVDVFNELWEQDHSCFVCERIFKEENRRDLQLHRIVYDDVGGDYHLSNCVKICADCHKKEYDYGKSIIFDKMRIIWDIKYKDIRCPYCYKTIKEKFDFWYTHSGKSYDWKEIIDVSFGIFKQFLGFNGYLVSVMSVEDWNNKRDDGINKIMQDFQLVRQSSIENLTSEKVEEWYKRYKIAVPAKNGRIRTWESIYDDKVKIEQVKIIKTDLCVTIVFKITTNFDLYVGIMRAFQGIGIDMTEVWNWKRREE